MTLQHFIFLAGLAHLGLLCAASLVPGALKWREELAPLPLFMRQLFWVYGISIALIITSFAALSLGFSGALASGTPLARAVCAVIAVFWGTRTVVQFFVFDASPYLRGPLMKIGYHTLTATFVYLTIVFAWAAACA